LGIDTEIFSITKIQELIRLADDLGQTPHEIVRKIEAFKAKLVESKRLLETFTPIETRFQFPRGAMLSRVTAIPLIRGITDPFRKLLRASLLNITTKLESLQKIAIEILPPVVEEPKTLLQKTEEFELRGWGSFYHIDNDDNSDESEQEGSNLLGNGDEFSTNFLNLDNF
jgi:hypothetical protein